MNPADWASGHALEQQNRVEGLDVVLGRLSGTVERMVSAIHEAGDEIGSLLADYAKAHHLWHDRTGATQQSTKGGVVEQTAQYVLVALSAGMSYDVFLELAHEGKYAWLWPAVQACKPQILEILRKRMG